VADQPAGERLRAQLLEVEREEAAAGDLVPHREALARRDRRRVDRDAHRWDGTSSSCNRARNVKPRRRPGRSLAAPTVPMQEEAG
jgi:hypothetical protein